MKQLTQRRRIIILRDDHIGETLGAIFLEPSADKEDWTISLVRKYLGRRVRVLKVELRTERAEIEVVVQAWSEEAARLVATARDLKNKGARRNALELFRQALELDPLNHAAATELGLLLAELERFPEALAMLKRARETGPEDAALLYGLGQTSLQLERTASAISYLERAYELSPGHFGARRALTELGRKPKPLPRSSTSALRSAPVVSDKKHG
jgi:tetratricopeptide (TPR) repeat protein